MTININQINSSKIIPISGVLIVGAGLQGGGGITSHHIITKCTRLQEHLVPA